MIDDQRPITVREILPYIKTKRGQIEVANAINEYKADVLGAEVERLQAEVERLEGEQEADEEAQEAGPVADDGGHAGPRIP